MSEEQSFLEQLPQAADNAPRYQLLARLGAPERMRARSVDIQVFLSFFLPLALALVHAAVGMTAANAVIAEVGKVDAAASSAVAAVLLLPLLLGIDGIWLAVTAAELAALLVSIGLFITRDQQFHYRKAE